MTEMEPETEATEADVAEQQQPLVDAAPDEPLDATTEATPADVLEQRQNP